MAAAASDCQALGADAGGPSPVSTPRRRWRPPSSLVLALYIVRQFRKVIEA
ncbi:hypothetical protein AJ80_00356 [Polytolypa hystricis UAMH7299]|uniref:Uncharacterized protein n=1 Tax=Polytolypa hystricis (strain UAMH7299) TaxID=1447883 RepID=A0A2B7Z4P8_POLH7|nr:hypothetical protein AJ80_00356 [Polytolypa hystricis UAMH7299]